MTFSTLQTIFPAIPAFLPAIDQAVTRFDLSTVERKAAFLAQCGHESAGFTHFIENLNYGYTGLMATWPKRFPDGIAQKYSRNPQAIANRVYANRMGNGDEASGDGWKYRGRGAIQITGKSMYENFAAFMEMSLDDVVAFMETHEGAILSAGWYWSVHGLNQYADKLDIAGMTRVINGGENGLAERAKLFGDVKLVLEKAAQA